MSILVIVWGEQTGEKTGPFPTFMPGFGIVVSSHDCFCVYSISRLSKVLVVFVLGGTDRTPIGTSCVLFDMSHVIARNPSDNWDLKSRTARKWHIITNRSRGEYWSTKPQPRCGQDGWIATEDNSVNSKECSTEELIKYVENGLICQRCWSLYESKIQTKD